LYFKYLLSAILFIVYIIFASVSHAVYIPHTYLNRAPLSLIRLDLWLIIAYYSSTIFSMIQIMEPIALLTFTFLLDKMANKLHSTRVFLRSSIVYYSVELELYIIVSNVELVLEYNVSDF
jgi:hypothetical protein